jgi:hypothetical protein
MELSHTASRLLVNKRNNFIFYGEEWVDNIKMDLREIGWDGMDWIELAQDRD